MAFTSIDLASSIAAIAALMGLHRDRENELIPAGNDQAQAEFAVKFDYSLIVGIQAALHVLLFTLVKLKNGCRPETSSPKRSLP